MDERSRSSRARTSRRVQGRAGSRSTSVGWSSQLVSSASRDGFPPSAPASRSSSSTSHGSRPRSPPTRGERASSDEAWVAGRGGSPLTAGPAAWLRGGSPGASVVFRQEVAWALQQDPLGRSIGYTLAAAALLALVLAIAGLWVTVLGDLHDERHDLADLEGQGANLGELRQHVRVRALALLGFGILAGVALGAVLARLVVALLAVSAGASVPDPPLVLELEWSNIVLAGAVLVVAAVLVVELTLRVRFREDEPLGERAALG